MLAKQEKALVAQEVRELAQRSATAAKEIKALIHASTMEVDTGVQLVRETGMALKEIAARIADINQHMSAIATASREQSIGLAEVNTAVTLLDQTTQQNAAMVEQSTAASTALAQEAEKLRELVGQFNLGATTTASSAVVKRIAQLGCGNSVVELRPQAVEGSLLGEIRESGISEEVASAIWS